MQRLQEILQDVDSTERARAQRGLHIGKLVNEYSSSYEQGDFLIRSVVQIDTRNQTLAINDAIRRGQTVKFQIRDAEAAHEDLVEALGCESDAMGEETASAAFLFSCSGRGSHMFSQDHHDIGVLQSELGDIPAAGFFAAGEIGPIAGKNFLHGFTASLALLRPK
ncbi:MAG: FIST C-terminal domain-containing protein [Planctomycetota bacterium]